MKRTRKSNAPGRLGRVIIGSSLLGTSFLGCAGYQPYVDPPPPLGSDIDPIFKLQEEDAEASKYVVYMHEFELNKSNPDGTNTGGWRLNGYGEDHLKQIAVNGRVVVDTEARSNSAPMTNRHTRIRTTALWQSVRGFHIR